MAKAAKLSPFRHLAVLATCVLALVGVAAAGGATSPNDAPVDAAEPTAVGEATSVLEGALASAGEGVGVGEATSVVTDAIVPLGEGVGVRETSAVAPDVFVPLGEGVAVGDQTLVVNGQLLDLSEPVAIGDGTVAAAVNVKPTLVLNALHGLEGGAAKAEASFVDPDQNQRWTGTVSYGDGSPLEPLTLRADHTFSLSHVYADDGTYTVTVAVNDGAGGSDVASTQALVANVAPTAQIANDGPVDEGGSATVSLSHVVDPSPDDTLAGFTYAFACDGGSFAAPGTSASAACTFDDGPSQHTVRAKVIDKDGGETEYETTVAVRNVAPTAELVAGAAVEGAPVAMSFADVHDPSSADTAAGFVREVACDGATFAAVTTCTFDDGPSTHLVRGKITDKDGGSTVVETTVEVANAAPTGSLANDGPVDEGAPAGISATATDASAADRAAGFGYRFACDGTTFAPATPIATTSCTFDDGPSTHVVRVELIDKDGGSTTVETTVEVRNVAPTATLAPVAPVDEGSPFTVALTSPHDVSAADTAAGFQYAFDCGDGHGFSAFSASATAACPTDDNGPRTLGAQIRDKDGGVTAYSGSVDVGSVAPTATVVAPQAPVAEGSSFTVALIDPVDPSARDVAAGFSYAFDCGDGYGPPASTSTATCTAVDDPSVPVRARITDKDGASTEYTRSVPVANVAPSLTLTAPSAPPVVSVGSSVSVAGTFTDPGVRDTHTCSVAWGDGTTTPAATTETGGSGSCTATHTYAAPTVGTLTLTVTDDDGGSASRSITVVVFDPNGGFLTGGGWVDAAGRAKTTFSVDAKFQGGVPKGSVEAQTPAGKLKDTGLAWLVVAGSRAQLAGTGTLDGRAGYTFRVAASDGPDGFRVAISDATGAVVYDNVPGAAWDLASAQPQPLGGGSIQIH